MIRSWRLWYVVALLAERNGVCYCGADLRDHSGWDNHGPVWMVHPDEEPLRKMLDTPVPDL